METEHEMSNIRTSQVKTDTTTEIGVTKTSTASRNTGPPLPGYGILARTDDDKTH